jgi:hypothetical protein
MSASKQGTTSGGCYCGAVRLRLDAAPTSVVHCHCSQCRRLSGAAFTTWVSVSKESLALSGAAALTAFRVTDDVTRHFCKVCGAHIYTEDARLPAVQGIPAGAIDGGLPATPTAHYFVGDKAPWHTIADGLRQFGGESGGEPVR